MPELGPRVVGMFSYRYGNVKRDLRESCSPPARHLQLVEVVAHCFTRVTDQPVGRNSYVEGLPEQRKGYRSL